jgi:hypothetical protein
MGDRSGPVASGGSGAEIQVCLAMPSTNKTY